MRHSFVVVFIHLLVVSIRSSPILTSNSSEVPEDDVGFYKELEDILDEDVDVLEESEEKSRKFQPEMGNEPPVTNSQIANLFGGNILDVLKTNEAQYIDVIAKYTNTETQIFSCLSPGETLNFPKFTLLIKHLFLYFKNIYPDGQSFTMDSDQLVRFEIKQKGVSQDSKEINLKWEGEAKFNSHLGHYVFSLIRLASDCTNIPQEFPTGPTETFSQYLERLQSALLQDLFLTNQKHQKASYEAFSTDFLIGRARVQFCEKSGQVMDRKYFADYLFKRYGETTVYSLTSTLYLQNAPSYTPSKILLQTHEFKTEQFSSYQTDAFLTVTVNYPSGAVTRDTFRFRVSAQSEVINGWPHWWVDYVEVMCPVDLNVRTDPKDLKEKFMGQVCSSIGPMINDGPSTQSRSTFLSHLNSAENAGFWAIVCDIGTAPVAFIQFSSWLTSWTTHFTSATLQKQSVDDYDYFSFTCHVEFQKTGGRIEKEFKMKAFYEVDKWMIKEIRVGCDINK